jgi:multisubunit Na+/H+ antiporter MnhB subunit
MSALFDVIVALLVLALALRLLSTNDLFQAVVLFIAFGLALSMVWVRAGAIDVALAEVALGAGVTGALLVNTQRRLRHGSSTPTTGPRAPVGDLLLPLLSGTAATAAALAVILSPRAPRPLAPLVFDSVQRTDLGNAVTAVLLEFRGYDTLLEIGVLLAGITAVWALERGRPAVPARADAAVEPVLAALVGWIVPLAVITAVYLTWYGSHGPGGAFQAGAVLAGAAVLMLAAGFMRPRGAHSLLLRGTAAAGLFIFAAVALHTAVFDGAMLRYPPASAYYWILAIEVALTVSIAAILADLFVDVPAGWDATSDTRAP